MKFSKTFCKPNAVIQVVPVGLPIKLEYNAQGVLQNFSIGLTLDLDPRYEDTDAGEFDKGKLFPEIKKLVPATITTTGGTTWIYGVLYTDKIPTTQGVLPQALYSDYINLLLKGESFTFYAGFVKSLAAMFQGPMVILNYLKMQRFETLPQAIVNTHMNEEVLHILMNPATYPFRYAFVSGFFVYENLECRYTPMNLMQVNVKSDPKPVVDKVPEGYLKGQVKTDSKIVYNFNYSTILHHGITKGTTLLLERDLESSNDRMNVLAVREGITTEKPLQVGSQTVTCPTCGKVYYAGSTDAPVYCDDPHCLSHSYHTAAKMLKVLGLEELPYEKYRQMVDQKTIICLTDLLEVQPYKDAEIESTLAEAIYAAMPYQVAPQFNIMERFANKCNNQVDTVKYYLDNPLRIETDLDITDPLVKRMIAWLEDPYNVSTLTTLFDRVKIATKLEKFEGAPIFRGNTIALTGKFKRGDYSEIESILMSYAAKVVPSIEPGEDLPDVLLIGSFNEGISGQMVQKANTHNIPIAYEDDFFAQYEIDKDLVENLL